MNVLQDSFCHNNDDWTFRAESLEVQEPKPNIISEIQYIRYPIEMSKPDIQSSGIIKSIFCL